MYGLDYLSLTNKSYLVGTRWLGVLMLRVQLKQKSFLIHEDSFLDFSGREHSSFCQWCEMSVWAGKCHEAWSDELPSFLPGFIMHSGSMLHRFYLCLYINLVRKYVKGKALKNIFVLFHYVLNFVQFFSALHLSKTYSFSTHALCSSQLSPCIICLTLRDSSWDNCIIPQMWFSAINSMENLLWNSLTPWHFLGISLSVNSGFQSLSRIKQTSQSHGTKFQS